jgi:hypothetical protein
MKEEEEERGYSWIYFLWVFMDKVGSGLSP